MNFSELIAFLEQINRRPNRALSQSFLIDDNICEKIVKTAEILPIDTVLEIGPGPGTLTSHLLKTGARVIAIEKDPVFATELSRWQTPDGRLDAIHADFLKFDLSSLSIPFKVVANIPYHITTPILEKLLVQKNIQSSTLMVQHELATRLSAKSGEKEYSSLSLFFSYHAQISASFKVSASCFYPKPQVDSKVLKFEQRPPFLNDSSPFFALTRRAFQKRRKMILATLKPDYNPDRVRHALQRAGVRSDARPESLSLEQWIAFYTAIKTSDASPLYI